MKPSLFKSKMLGDVLKFFNGKSITPGGDGEYPVYGSNGLIGQNDEYTHQNGLIIGRVGAYCGAIKYCKTQFWASDNTIVGQPKDNTFDIRYIYYLLRDLNLNRYAGGSAQPLLTQTVLRQVSTLVPPLPTQRKIATVLSAYDDLIENNTRRIKILEEMASTIYREWFVEFRFPGHEQVEVVESELGLIPQGWEVQRLSDLVETQHGYTESATEDEVGPKFVRGKDINKNSYIDWDTVPFCPIESEKYAKYQLHTDDILVIRMADPGKVTIIEKEIDAVFASYLIRLKLISNRLSPYYLFYTLLDERYQNYIYGASTGTTRRSASAGVMTSFALVVPTDQVRDRFEMLIDSLRKTLNVLLEKNTKLRQTHDLLLPKLISGEIDVSELDINID